MTRKRKSKLPPLKWTRDLEIVQSHTHTLSGAKLILGRKKDDGRFVLGWIAPWQKIIKDYALIDNEAVALQRFKNRAARKPPATPALRRDFQLAKVYEWERKFIDRHSPSNMTEDQMARIVQKVSGDFNMRAPRLEYEKKGQYSTSLYHPTPHKISMSVAKLTWVLHETGHSVDMRVNGNVNGQKWSHHGPSFVRTIIRLADRYQVWQDPVKLEEEAIKMGILVTPEEDLPPLPS